MEDLFLSLLKIFTEHLFGSALHGLGTFRLQKNLKTIDVAFFSTIFHKS